MKKNFLFGLIGAGALMLSAGVGFAAWTITGGNSSTDGNLSLKADATVTDSHININSGSSGSKWTDDSIEFKPVIYADKTYKYKWLSASDALGQENLTATYHLVGTAAKNASLTLTATITETTNVYSGLVTKGLVANPTLSVSTTTVTADENGSFSQDITVTFAWGNHFKLNNAASAVNPYEFYNSQAYSDSLASDASTNISALNALKNCIFKLSLSLTAK